MKICYSIILFILITGFSGCGFAERERKIKEQETGLAQREQALLIKEQDLIQKEAALHALAQALDSNKKAWDTVGVYDEAIVGEWNVTMTCVETSCDGSAIGDKKVEKWVFSYENMSLKVSAYSGKNFTRTYIGWYKNNILSLRVPDNPEGTSITVQLRPATDKQNKFIGRREIQQPNCKIVYELDASRKAAGKN